MMIRLGLALALCSVVLGAASLPSEIEVTTGAVNAVRIRSVAIYADTPRHQKAPAYLLLTHARREMLATAPEAIGRGAAAVVPAEERSQFESPGALWAAFERGRFHDY